jgi:hypothetical protein
MPIGNGGIIGPANVPTLLSAKGVWSLREAQLAQKQGIWPLGLIPDPYFEYTTLLLPGNGTNGANNNTFLDSGTANSGSGFPINCNGNTTQGTFSPFSQTGWGNYFDGSGDYLTIADNAALRIGTQDFWIEAWVYVTSFSSVNTIAIKRTYNTTGTGTWFFGIDTNGAVDFDQIQTGATIITTNNNAISLNTWTHVAVSRDSSDVWRIFINGNSSGTTSPTNNFDFSTTEPLVIGNVRDSTNISFKGYISNLRFGIGSPNYTSNFIPSTTPLTAITNTQLLTCQSNRFIDNSTNSFTITPNGSPSVVAFSPFNPTLPWSSATNGGSGYFDGSGDYLNTSTTQIIPSGSYTVEAWGYPTTSSDGYLVAQGTAGNAARFAMGIESNVWYVQVGATRVSSSAAPALNAWTHVAATFNGSTLTLYVNGVSVGTPASTSTNAQNTTLRIGSLGPSDWAASYWTGYIGQVRVSNTVRSVSVPTAPYSNDGNTSFLLNFTNAGIYDATGKNNIETVNDARISTAITPQWGNGSILLEPSVGSTQDYLLSSAPLSELAFLHNGTPWTVEGWFYTGSTSLQTILSTNGASVSIGIVISISSSTAGNLSCQIFRGVSGSSLSATSSGSVWNVNTWNYFAVVLDASKNLTLYINGSQVATTSGSSFSFSSSNPTYPLAIGRYQFSTPGGYFNGYLQDIRITRGIARTITTPTAAFPTL